MLRTIFLSALAISPLALAFWYFQRQKRKDKKAKVVEMDVTEKFYHN